MVASDTENFLQHTCTAKKNMVLDLGFPGDTIHLLPALWMPDRNFFYESAFKKIARFRLHHRR